uniref:Uncharacterized protein n=1 Tax=Canis lupus dingo TaxID=286419 RepID=A0A8C0JUM3_CANLU
MSCSNRGHSQKWQGTAQWRQGQILNGCVCSRGGESLPRTPELLAQGPVSLRSPEKHPRAL